MILMNDCSTDVERVLNEFFTLGENGWENKRADAEIAKYHGKSEKAREAGKASAQARKQRTLNVGSTNVQPNKKQETRNNNQKPIKKIQAPEGVSSEVWDSFIAQRQKARAVVTDLVIKSIANEAQKAGWTLEQALTEITHRGWRGFKADWVKDKPQYKNVGDRNREVLTGLTRGLIGGGNNVALLGK